VGIAVTLRTWLCAIGSLAACALCAPVADAGVWMQVSCENPNGSAAPSEGWSGFAAGGGYGSNNDTQCSPGNPMFALMSDDVAVAVPSAEVLEYQPPSGSTLIGGTVDVGLYADGGGYNASGTAVAYEPAYSYDASDVFFQCASGLAPCSNGTNDYSGTLGLPTDRGGNFYLAAGCGGQPPVNGTTFYCNQHPSHDAWGLAQLYWADFLLSNSSSPEGAGFSGSALQPHVRGTAHLVFTASDPGGPGIYLVTVTANGKPVFSGTPNTNGGERAPVQTDPSTGALMFDHQQPCPQTEVVDVPVATTGLPDGRNELAVSLTDAADNTSTVFDQAITTSNPSVTPVPRRGAVRARFSIGWRWAGSRTRLESIHTRHLPRDAHVSVRCLGAGCPRLRVGRVSARHTRRILRELRGARFEAGDQLLITVTAPGRKAERIEVVIRDGNIPHARLL
jgi:hypothetical protein